MTREERVLAAHYAATFEANASGRVVLEDLRRKFEYRPTYVPGDYPGTTEHRSGETNVLLEIRAQLEAATTDPDDARTQHPASGQAQLEESPA